MRPRNTPNRSNIEILVAEDSPTQAEQLRHFLESHGFAVRIASDGKEALAAAQEQQPALIISDIVMPEMDGYQLCKAVRADVALKETPVVLLTSLSSPQDVIEALKSGADNFIRKPYDENHLLLRIEHILANRRLRTSDRVKVGVELFLGGEKHFITAERQQILDLLISTYEQAVQLCTDLKTREEQLERAHKILKGIYTIAKGLNQAQSEQDVLDMALSRALELPDVRAGWIFLRSEGSDFKLAASQGLPPGLNTPEAMEGECLCCRQVLAGEIRYATNIVECERLTNVSGITLGLKSHVSLPLWNRDRVIGVMNLVGTEDVLFSEDDLRVLNGIGNQIGVALDRCRMHEHLEQLVRVRTAALTSEIEVRKRAEFALKESENRYRMLFDANPLPLWV
ncbi:MAG TPA: response regulator, partial [Bacteroidota bacterium]